MKLYLHPNAVSLDNIHRINVEYNLEAVVFSDGIRLVDRNPGLSVANAKRLREWQHKKGLLLMNRKAKFQLKIW